MIDTQDSELDNEQVQYFSRIRHLTCVHGGDAQTANDLLA